MACLRPFIVALGSLILLTSCSFKTPSTIQVDGVYLIDVSKVPFYAPVARDRGVDPIMLGIQIHSTAANVENSSAAIHFCAKSIRSHGFAALFVFQFPPQKDDDLRGSGVEAVVPLAISHDATPKFEKYDLRNSEDDLCINTFEPATTDISNTVQVSRDMIAAALKGRVYRYPESPTSQPGH